jgi:hypothetical protein
MEIDIETIYALLASDSSKGLATIIDNALQVNIHSKKDWDDLITILQVGCLDTYQKHWLKIHHIILSLFDVRELLGVDCTIFNELRSVDTPNNIEQASDSLFDILVEIARNQFRNGGSTLFFNVDEMSSTRSAIIVRDLVKARYRETVFVLEAIDGTLPTLTKEWLNVSRLWRTGNGYRILRARNHSTLIHIKEYKQIRNLLLKELNIEPEKFALVCSKLRKKDTSNYLQFSNTLDDFVTGLVASHGIRGAFEPHYKAWIDHEGLDEF